MTFWLLYIFKGDHLHVSWFDKNFHIGFFADIAEVIFFFQTLHDHNFASGLPIKVRFDDLDLVSRLQVYQNHKLLIVF